ncbi:MAG: hypothetical protein BroJett011_46790 [Chloroflexota bacterium]|nr:MAG: hypothetical protein BroJett011_46790 [Chloroflexota bacterium]
MQLKLIFAGFIGSLLGGSCALATLLLVILTNHLLLAPAELPRPREAAVLNSWAMPSVTPVPPVTETPLPPANTPALLPTVTPPLDLITPATSPDPGQGQDQISPMVATPTPVFGEIATRVVIPSIGLDTPIVLAPRQGDSWTTDHLGPIVCQLEGTAAPGSGGNIVLGGHYTLPETNGGPGPFYNLKHLGPGDKVLLYQGEAEFEYIIDGFQTVDEKAVEVTYSTGMPQLTLLTCTQWDRNQGRYVKRLVVTGHLV